MLTITEIFSLKKLFEELLKAENLTITQKEQIKKNLENLNKLINQI